MLLVEFQARYNCLLFTLHVKPGQQSKEGKKQKPLTVQGKIIICWECINTQSIKEVVLLIYKRPEKYFPERDKILHSCKTYNWSLVVIDSNKVVYNYAELYIDFNQPRFQNHQRKRGRVGGESLVELNGTFPNTNIDV